MSAEYFNGNKPGDFGMNGETDARKSGGLHLPSPREPWREVRDGRHVVLCGGDVVDGFCQRCWQDLRPPARLAWWRRIFR